MSHISETKHPFVKKFGEYVRLEIDVLGLTDANAAQACSAIAMAIEMQLGGLLKLTYAFTELVYQRVELADSQGFDFRVTLFVQPTQEQFSENGKSHKEVTRLLRRYLLAAHKAIIGFELSQEQADRQ